MIYLTFIATKWHMHNKEGHKGNFMILGEYILHKISGEQRIQINDLSGLNNIPITVNELLKITERDLSPLNIKFNASFLFQY